jgi:hypothetical protein
MVTEDSAEAFFEHTLGRPSGALGSSGLCKEDAASCRFTNVLSSDYTAVYL